MNSRKKIIALTGGIGSGKSYVCQLLAQQGINVYDCDAAAKRIMRTNHTVISALQQLVGPQVYQGGVLQKAVLAKYLLTSETNKQAVNGIVHPAVAHDFLLSDDEWIESAILFDAHFDQLILPTYIICVTAPANVRIQRIMQRDHITHQQAAEWVNKQMPQALVVRQSNYQIINDGKTELMQQVKRIVAKIASM